MLLDPALTGGYRRVRRRSALDDEFEAEEDAQARELKELRVEEMVTKRKARIAKLKREIEETPAEAKPSEGPKIPGISITTARQIAALPDEERERVLETYILMQAAEAKHANAVLPAIVGFARANPGSSQNQMLEYAKVMNEQLKTGIELAKGTESKQQQVDPWKGMEMMRDMVKENKLEANDPWKPVELVMDLVKNSVTEPLEKMAERLQPQPSPFEAILMNDRLFTRARELGIFGKHDTGATRGDIDLKIEELRGERQLSMKKLELEMQKNLLETQAKERRNNQLISALTPMSAFLAGPIDQRMRQFGRQTAGNTPGPSQRAPNPGNAVLIQCSCGYRGNVTFQGPIPPSLNCPACGDELVVGGVGSGEPEKPGREA